MEPLKDNTVLFPRFFHLYNAETLGSDLNIVDDHQAIIYHISHHKGFSSKPSVILHSGPSPTFPPLATATFHYMSSSFEITLPPTTNIPMTHSGILNSVWSFNFTLPNGETERFEWKKSSGAEVASLDGRSRGLKLVRVGTGEVMAAYTAASMMSFSEKGKFTFVENVKGVGGEKGLWDLLVVVSMLGVTEKMRRKRKAAAAGAA